MLLRFNMFLSTYFDFIFAKLTVYLNFIILLSLCFDVFLILFFVFCTPFFHFFFLKSGFLALYRSTNFISFYFSKKKSNLLTLNMTITTRSHIRGLTVHSYYIEPFSL